MIIVKKISNIKYIIQMISAFLGAFLVINFASFFYSNTARAITNPDRYTTTKHQSKAYNFYGREGYGITATDKNGFYNDGQVFPKDAGVLCIGSSQTEAVNVDMQENFVSVLNQRNPSLRAYNLGVSGSFLSSTLYRLPFIPQNFPKCTAIVAETPNLPTLEEWDKIIHLLENNDAPIENQDWKDSNIIFRLYRSMPYASLLRQQINELRNSKKARMNKTTNIPQEGKQKNIKTAEAFEYRQKAHYALKLLRKKLGDMPLVIIYLPQLHFENNGTITITNDDELQKILKEACKTNHIMYGYDQLCSTFMENYETHRIVPYGFLNSQIGQGHLNVEGHRMVAETLYNIFEKEGIVQ